jgi:hypothetical protein
MWRGYAFQDLARFHRHLGAAYYTGRRESENARPTPWTDYYAARYQAAVDSVSDPSPLLAVLRSNSLSAGYSRRLRVWIAREQFQAGNTSAARETWAALADIRDPAVSADLALAQWQAGEDLSDLQCPSETNSVAGLRCILWESLRAENWSRVREIQRELINRTRPTDEIQRFEDFSVRFYDPGVLQVLALADFRAAAAAYRQVSGSQKRNASILAVVSAVEGRDFEAARELLNAAPPHPLRSLYRAVWAQETGGTSTSGFTSARQHQNRGIRAAWAESAAPYTTRQEAVRAYCNHLAESPPENMDQALRLGRAALTLGDVNVAYRLLQAAYPITQHNNLRVIDPAYLATFAHVKFHAGRRFSSQILSHLEVLQSEYPVASIVYDLAQGYFIPERRDGNVR